MSTTLELPLQSNISLTQPTKKNRNFREVHNLSTEQVNYYCLDSDPVAVVTQSYAEEHHLMSKWTDANQSKDFSAFPVTIGRFSVACGDWSTLK